MAASVNMTSKWSGEDVMTFLEVYEYFESMWNIRHPDYCNKMG
jgi:hypothetical protein